MRDIHGSSRNLTKLTEVVDRIAFLSNLLALNAATAAAVTGGDSRGLALVADEVRDLARRGAQAAQTSPVEEQEQIL